jgi:hypothetical protein
MTKEEWFRACQRTSASKDGPNLMLYCRCILESTNPRNISLYRRHGIEQLGTIQAGSSPTLVPMLRRLR